MSKDICIVEGCEKPRHTAAGWCSMHYWRVKNHGDPNPALKRGPRDGICVIDECNRVRYNSRGWCKKHYDRWLTHGDALRADKRFPTDGSFGFSAAHKRILRARGPAKDYPCEFCGERANDWAYDHKDLAQLRDGRGYAYSGDVDHYMPLCKPCHVRMDQARVQDERRTRRISA